MPWQETSPQQERRCFIEYWSQQEWSMTQLCKDFGIAPKTGYKWLRRYQEGGWPALADRSRAPKQPAQALAPEVAETILALRTAHMTWGPRKLKARLEQIQPRSHWPAASTIGALLKQEGLTVRRRRKQQTPPYRLPFADCTAPNTVWCADFKGWFRTGDGQPCYPFTVTDAHSRYLLRCQALPDQKGERLFPLWTALFQEYGLPEAIRTDNGPPFASTGLGGLSRLSLWWIKLGIRPERIARGCPQQNGRHERMHRTLKEATAQPPQQNHRTQQRTFAAFQQEYNEQRPHEALAYATPASCYAPSPRRFPLRLPAIVYPAGLVVRRVRHSGEIRWHNHLLYVSELLAGEPVGLEQLDDRHWQLYVSFLPVAILDSHTLRLQRPAPPKRAGPASRDSQQGITGGAVAK